MRERTGQAGLGPIVLVDDDGTTRAMMRAWLESDGHRVIDFEEGGRAIAELPRDAAAVCLDLGLDDVPGMHVLQHLRASHPDLPIIVVTARGDLDSAVEAMRAGAYDYLVKPLDRVKLRDSVQRAVDRHVAADSVRRARSAIADTSESTKLIGRSEPMRELQRQIGRVLESDVTVCIFGESGTGKELVSHAIHSAGKRRRGPFVAVNCASIPHSLQESELFGHERGSFTGAAGVHRGRLEQANNGTLFLDELGEMSLSTQASLLRAIQERSIRRVGSTTEIPVNVRIICATHRDLAAEVRAGRFREDLYFRLVVFPIHLPSLRERTDDIPLLIGHFLETLKEDVGKDVRRVSADALTALARHKWPGNVRELQNVIHRAMLATDTDEIGLSHLPAEIRSFVLPTIPLPTAAASTGAAPGSGDEDVVTLDELERRAIVRALHATNGSVGKAARMLGMGRATLYRRIAAFGLTSGSVDA